MQPTITNVSEPRSTGAPATARVAAGRGDHRAAMRAHHGAGGGEQGGHHITSRAPLLTETPEAPTAIVPEPAVAVTPELSITTLCWPESSSVTLPALLSKARLPAAVMMVLSVVAAAEGMSPLFQ